MKRLATLVGLAALLPADLVAQRGGGDRTTVWQHLAENYDKDKDGRITREEYPRGDEKFTRFDRDGDGALTETDFAGRGRGGGKTRPANARRGPEGGRWRGGGPNHRNLAMIGVEIAKRADLDKDGSVPLAEWQNFVASLGADEDGVVTRQQLLGPAGGGRMAGMVLRAVDVDRDGDITTDDLGEVFAAMDADDSLTLQRTELGELPWPGEVAPDFELPWVVDANKTVKLSSFRGNKPVALIFGSYT